MDQLTYPDKWRVEVGPTPRFVLRLSVGLVLYYLCIFVIFTVTVLFGTILIVGSIFGLVQSALRGIVLAAHRNDPLLLADFIALQFASLASNLNRYWNPSVRLTWDQIGFVRSWILNGRQQLTKCEEASPFGSTPVRVRDVVVALPVALGALFDYRKPLVADAVPAASSMNWEQWTANDQRATSN